MNTATLERYQKYVIGNYTRYPVCLVRGEGSWVYDDAGQQYLDFWKGLLTGNMGISISDDPNTVTSLVFGAMPYTLALLVPAVVLSYVVGNRLGAAAARRKKGQGPERA